MQQGDWHPEDVKAAVRKKGCSLARIGAAAGLSRQAVALVLVRPGIAGEAAIAQFLEIAPQAIWPSRYHIDGYRKCPQPAANYRRRARFGP